MAFPTKHEVQNNTKQIHTKNDNVSGISSDIVNSTNMLNNSRKCLIHDKDLSSRKVIGLSITCSGVGLTSCALFIVLVTGFITVLPISLAILGVSAITAGLYLLLSGNKVRHNNSDNNASGNTNASKNENYNNAKNYMPNYAQHSSATEIANKSNINNTITSTCDEIKNIKKSSIQSNGGYNTGTHEQKPNINSDIKIDNSGTHHVLNKANLPNLNKNSITYKNQDAINKNNMYKAMISLNNTNENLGTNQVAQIEINKNIVNNEKKYRKIRFST